MCAKKTPTTPTKQNLLTGAVKSLAKKAPKQTTKKADEKSTSVSAVVRDVKSVDAKKQAATSPKKANQTETKVSTPSTPVKGKKTSSRDNSADNSKGKKPPPINGKTNKIKSNDSDRDKLSENKSNQARDSKITAKSDEVKSKCVEQCNKVEKSSSSLSNGESDNSIKDKEKVCKKPRAKLSPNSTPKKVNNRNSADKAKLSKVAKKAGKEKECKIKISNELKNLGIEMSNSNASLAVVIQEGMSSGVKTSICEMVKTKARYCSNINSTQSKKSSEIKAASNKTNKESQEKVLDVKVKTSNETVDGKAFKLIETTEPSDDKKVVQEPTKNTLNECDIKTAVNNNRSKISALVNAKNSNKIKSSNELKKCENVNKSNESEASKPVKRKYVKKKKQEDAADGAKNSSIVSEAAARNSDKLDQNKSSCLDISDGASGEIKSASKADTKIESEGETKAVGEKDETESSLANKIVETAAKLTPTKVAKAKNQPADGPKVKKAVQSLSSDDKLKIDTKVAAEKIKRKYVKKAKPTQSEAVDKVAKPQKDVQKPIKVERDKSSDGNELKKPATDAHKNGVVDKKKAPEVCVADDALKVPVKEAKSPQTKVAKAFEKIPAPPVLKQQIPKKEVETKEKVCNPKAPKKPTEKKITEKQLKVSPKKQKLEIKQEDGNHDSSSCESANSSDTSDFESEHSGDTFKKPHKPVAPRDLRNITPHQEVFKRSRVASLNAIAKVHYMFENENRSTLEANIAKAIRNSLAMESTDGDDDERESKHFATKR